MGSLVNSFMLFRFLYQLLLVHLMVVNLCFSLQPLCLDDEKSSLLQFRDSLKIDLRVYSDTFANSKVLSWTAEGESDCCSWDGVKCDQDTGHVIELDVSNSYLYGSLTSSSTLFRLVHLEKLILAGNDFSYSSIPTAFSQLTRLSYLDLSLSGFSGQIPNEISRLSRLSYLDLSSDAVDIVSGQKSLLQLKNPGLKGLLMNLTSIEELYLNFVDISSTVPDMLADLSSLKVLELRGCGLNGEFPRRIFQLPNLQVLSLSENNFRGPIPESFSRLRNLEALLLDDNYLSGSVNFDMFLSLKNLSQLSLSDNNLTVVTEPSHIKSTLLPQFTLLSLASCNLSKFPDFLMNQKRLKLLNLRGNQIGGRIPSWIWTTSEQTLKVLTLANNSLTGFEQNPVAFPDSIAVLVLSSNLLTGPLPIPPPSTFLFDVSDNHLTEEFSPSICDLQSLKVLHLSNNRLSGVLPQCLGNSGNPLTVLNLRNNSFTGSIPDTFTDESRLRVMDLSYNQIRGQVPRSLANCRMLEKLVLSNNQLDDIFPSWLGNLPELRVLVLKSNKFHGVIDDAQTDFQPPKLRIIDISNNEFVGKLPSKYIQSWNAMKDISFNLSAYLQTNPTFNAQEYLLETNYDVITTMGNDGLPIISYVVRQEDVAVIDLSSNKFDGEIPQVIGGLKGLNVLNLSNNILSGGMPSSFGNLTELEFLDLSHNKLSGEIPKQLTNLKFLQVFNVSHNLLKGPIPQGNKFDTFESSSYEGNLGLCGHPLQLECGNSEASTSESELEFDWKVVGIGYGCGLAIGLLIGQIVISKKRMWSAMSYRIFNNSRRRKGWMRLMK